MTLQMRPHLTRRELLAAGLAAVAAGVRAAPGGQGVAGAGTAPFRIDIHQHFVSPSFLAALTAKNAISPVPGLAAWKGYSPARALEAIDRIGVAQAMLSITAPGVWFGSAEEARALAREMNEYAAAKMVAAYPGRFGLFAVLPLPDVDGSLTEIAYAFDALKARGVGVLSSYGDRWLGDAAFAPVFDELNRRRAVVYVHPTDAACCPNLVRGVAPQMLEYPTDTTRTIVSLIVGGTASKCPNVRFVFSHAGGTVTAVAGRFLGAQASAESLARAPEPDSRLFHLRRFFYDTAGSANPINMQALKTLVGAPQIVFGTDAPFFDGAPQVEGLQRCGFSAAELRAIERDNALALLT
jgi:predicted TIM-barrel fold metal-dependent hydrolase